MILGQVSCSCGYFVWDHYHCCRDRKSTSSWAAVVWLASCCYSWSSHLSSSTFSCRFCVYVASTSVSCLMNPFPLMMMMFAPKKAGKWMRSHHSCVFFCQTETLVLMVVITVSLLAYAGNAFQTFDHWIPFRKRIWWQHVLYHQTLMSKKTRKSCVHEKRQNWKGNDLSPVLAPQQANLQKAGRWTARLQ